MALKAVVVGIDKYPWTCARALLTVSDWRGRRGPGTRQAGQADGEIAAKLAWIASDGVLRYAPPVPPVAGAERQDGGLDPAPIEPLDREDAPYIELIARSTPVEPRHDLSGHDLRGDRERERAPSPRGREYATPCGPRRTAAGAPCSSGRVPATRCHRVRTRSARATCLLRARSAGGGHRNRARRTGDRSRRRPPDVRAPPPPGPAR